MGSSKLNFNETIRRIPQKQLSPDAMSQGLIMVKLEVIDPEYAGVGAYPYKYLPIMFTKDTRYDNNVAKEGIVIPKGTIVSFVTSQTTITDGIPVPSGAGTIPQANDINGDLITAPIDWSFFGYDESVLALMVPCNGGSQSTIPYGPYDDEIGLWNKSTDSPLVISGNIPAGIVMEDVYQDIRGAYLNYQTHDFYSVVVSGRMSVPFVDTDKVNFVGGDVTDPGYASVWRKWQFLYFDGSTEGRSGSLLKSDKYGKFSIQSSAVDAVKTVQTVGRLLATDSRFPKELSATIQNYPGTRLLGVNTAGLPTDLYLFTSSILKAVGKPYDAKSCLSAVQSGAFGYARIQLSVGK